MTNADVEPEASVQWEFGEDYFLKEYIRIGKEMKTLLRFLRKRRKVKGKLARVFFFFSKYRKESEWGYRLGISCPRG